MLVFGLTIVMTWNFPDLGIYVPDWLELWLYPVDKTNLDMLRLLHFLAIAYLVVTFVPPQADFLRWRALQPLLRCGQHSLPVFCTGVFLSFIGHFVLTEVADTTTMEFVVSGVGILLLCLLAYGAQWMRELESAGKAPATARKAVAS